MHDCTHGRPKEEQAEVQQCGPYSSIVLAVLRVEREGKCRLSRVSGQNGQPVSDAESGAESSGARGGNMRRMQGNVARRKRSSEAMTGM